MKRHRTLDGSSCRSREIFDEMRGKGISSPEATAALIKALAKGGKNSSEALRLLGDMRAAAQGGGGRRGGGYEAGVYLGGMPGGIAEMEAAREKSEAEAQGAGFEGAIAACAVNGEWQKAVSLLDEMRQVWVLWVLFVCGREFCGFCCLCLVSCAFVLVSFVSRDRALKCVTGRPMKRKTLKS